MQHKIRCTCISISIKIYKYIKTLFTCKVLNFTYFRRSILVLLGDVAILENSRSNHEEDTYTAELSVSVGFNALLLAVVLLLLW